MKFQKGKYIKQRCFLVRLHYCLNFLLCFFILSTVLSCGFITGKDKSEKPNVILIVIDTLRADHIHSYGYYRETTPNLDNIASKGVKFKTAISPSSWSAPSHTTIVTGMQPYNHKVMDFSDTIEQTITPLQIHLKRQGYATGMFSSHLAVHTLIGRISEGFEKKLILKNDQDKEVLKAASEWVAKTEKPYFLNVILMTPHAPYNKFPPSYNTNLFTDDPPGSDRTYPFISELWTGDKGIPKSVRLGNSQRLGFYINRYDRAIKYVDQLIGRFLTEITLEGKLKNTLLIITSDHGEGLGEHDYFAHEFYLYDFLIRVPLIMYYPGVISPGMEWSQQVTLADIVPTILGFTGAEIPATIDGRDLSPWLKKNNELKDTNLITGAYKLRGHERYMVRSEKFKLIFDKKKNREEFYNLDLDPNELNNLIKAIDKENTQKPYQKMKKRINELVSAYSINQSDKGKSKLTKEVLEELKSLGYLQ